MWGWYKTINRAIAWCSALPERAARKVFFSVVSWLHPELNRIADEDERYWAAFITEKRQPSEESLGLFFMFFCVVFPIAGAVVAILISSWLGIGTDAKWPLLGGYGIGVVAPLALWLLLRLPRMRRAHITTLRNIGYDMCPECQYDMTGHAAEATRSRTCPECGATLPP